jgi:predicted metal-dependent hydrolase
MFIDFLSDFYGKTRPRTKRNPLGIKKPRPKLEPESLNWEVEHQIIPVELYRDPKRTGWRYSFGKNNVLLVRIPKLDNAQEAKLLEEVQLRLTERMKQKPELYDFFNQKKYYNDTVVNVGNREYTVKIFIEARKSCTGRLLVKKEGKIIDIRADAYLEEAVRQKTIGKLISRIVAADFLPEFSRRVDELNDRHFQQDIKNITFKNNHSNWGSCSSSNNLNFSSRLLFAPQIVQDYVIIHELAHLIELNHSDRFWDLVAKVMPNYEDQEMWLKLNAAACRF